MHTVWVSWGTPVWGCQSDIRSIRFVRVGVVCTTLTWLSHTELPQDFSQFYYSWHLTKQHPGVEFQILTYKRQRNIQTFVRASWLSSSTNSGDHQNKRGFDNWILITCNWVLGDVFALLFKQCEPRVQFSTRARHIWEPATEELIIYSKTKKTHTPC